ncbi:MAG: hypothetical protein Q8P90_01445 [bacterium]|nr:hypothetical protein [bacterium]
MKYQPSFGELFIDHDESDRNAIHIYLSTPTPLEEKNLGRIFVLIDLEDPQPFYEELVELIDSTFTNAYYRSSDFEVEAAFERSLHRVNKAVQDGISQYGEEWVYKLNGILGIVKGTEVHIAYVGAVETFLIQGDDIIDVLQKSKSEEIKPLKLFTNIISGECQDKSSMLFATSNLLDYLSLEKIRRTIKENTPSEAAIAFETVLTDNTTLSNIASLIMTMKKESATTEKQHVIDDEIERSEFSDREDSMNKLITQERTTDELLTPSIWPSIKKRVGGMSNAPDKVNDSESERKSPNYGKSKNKVITILVWIMNFLKNVGTQIVISLIYVGKKLAKLFRSEKTMTSRVGTSVSGAKGWLARLSTPRKIFLALAVLVLLFFIISVFAKDRSVLKKDQLVAYENTITDVENLVGEADSKQIMNDEIGARTAINNANELLSTVPTDSDIYTKKGESLQGRINELNNTLNKVIVINDLSPIGDFKSANEGASPNYITKIGDNIFGFNSNDEAVYRLNLSNSQASEIIPGSEENGAYASIENDSAATTLAVTMDKSFVQFNPVLEKISTVAIPTIEESLKINDIDIFGSRLYILDAATNMIYRSNRSGDTYGALSKWITETVDISTAVSFDIDSSIYVLLSNGSITKFDNGTQSEFSVADFSPGLSGATKLIKNDVLTPFYILNPETQHVVLLDNNGELQQQYTSDQFSGIKDIAVDEDNNEVFVLAGTSVYKFSL